MTGGLIAVGTTSTTATARGKGKGGERGNHSNGQGGPPSGTKNTCPDGTVLLAKYEVSGGSFVFEKDSGYLEVGDTFDFTVTETKDDGEILAFEVCDSEGVYDIHTLSVKTGAGVFREEVDDTCSTFDAREHDDSGPVQAISNVIICAKVWWQVDFGRGEVPIPPDYRGSGRGDDLVLAATGDGTDESVENPSLDRDGSDDFVEVPAGEFDVDLDAGTVSVTFEENTADKLHLASFETPGEYDNSEIEFQDLHAKTTTTTESGTMTVDIPRPEDFK